MLEKEHNDYVIMEAIQNRERNLQYKMDISNRLSQEYQKANDEKRLREQREIDDYRKHQNTSLDIKHEQSFTKYKSRINNLDDKVNTNKNNYVKFKQDYNINENRIEDFQDKCFNNYSKQGIPLKASSNIKTNQSLISEYREYLADQNNVNKEANIGGSNNCINNVQYSADNLNGFPEDTINQQNALIANNPDYKQSVNKNNLEEAYSSQVQEALDIDKFKVSNIIENQGNSNAINVNANNQCNYYNNNNNKINKQNNEFDSSNNNNSAGQFQAKNFNNESTFTNNSKCNNSVFNSQTLDFNSAIKNHHNSNNHLNKENSVIKDKRNSDFDGKIRENSPEYKQYYSFNPKKEYNNQETSSSLKRNIISHNNANHLEEVFQKSKQNYSTISKSILEFNKEQVMYKNLSKAMEDQNKKKVIEERMKEAQKIKLENMESNIIKQQKQSNYKSILDSQSLPYQTKHPQDAFKFYVLPKQYYLGNTMLDQNPILNPVNNYNFARYYLNRNGNLLNLSTK